MINNICQNSFSILMSLYNKEHPTYLHECLNSIKNQKVHAKQVVIVFDGFINEQLRKVVDTFKKELPIDIIQLEHNVGLGMALNEGLKHCKYDIVARMDTDDICIPERFYKQINYIFDNPNISIVGSSIDEYDESFTSFLFKRKTKSEHFDILKYAKYRSPFNHMTVVFRKKAVIQAGGYLHHAFMEDYNLWLRMLSLGCTAYNFDESLVLARTGSSMIQRRKGMVYVRSEIQLAKLKYQLRFNGKIESLFILFLRITPRILPKKILSYIYKIIRKY